MGKEGEITDIREWKQIQENLTYEKLITGIRKITLTKITGNNNYNSGVITYIILQTLIKSDKGENNKSTKELETYLGKYLRIRRKSLKSEKLQLENKNIRNDISKINKEINKLNKKVTKGKASKTSIKKLEENKSKKYLLYKKININYLDIKQIKEETVKKERLLDSNCKKFQQWEQLIHQILYRKLYKENLIVLKSNYMKFKDMTEKEYDSYHNLSKDHITGSRPVSPRAYDFITHVKTIPTYRKNQVLIDNYIREYTEHNNDPSERINKIIIDVYEEVHDTLNDIRNKTNKISLQVGINHNKSSDTNKQIQLIESLLLGNLIKEGQL